MIKNFLKSALRSHSRQKGFSFINLSGLAVGMACCILILLFVQDELSYDHHFENSNRLYRVVTDGIFNGALNHYALCPMALPPVFSDEIPEVENFTRVFGFGRRQLLKVENKSFEEMGIFIVDSAFFEVFSHQFISGDKHNALLKPGSVVLTESSARRLFGSDDPMGKRFSLQAVGEVYVTGIVEDTPANSHFSFRYVLPFITLSQNRQKAMQHWIRLNGSAYVLLKEGADVSSVERKILDVWEKNTGEYSRSVGIQLEFPLQKVTDIHLHSNRQVEIGINGDFTQVIIFSAVAVFVLLIACMNFMNLSTARFASRAREVGLRKLFGANRKKLIFQFLFESILFSLVSLLVALGISILALPFFNAMTGKALTLNSFGRESLVFGLFCIIAFAGIIAGSYPAFFLSRFEPDRILRGSVSQGMKSPVLRKTLVVTQFTLSVMLIIGTGVILDQIAYMKNKDLGFPQDRIMVINIQTGPVSRNPDPVMNALQMHLNISDVSASTGVPSRIGEFRFFVPEGSDSSQSHGMHVVRSDFGYLRTLGLKTVAGRDFSKEILSDSNDAFIINETAARKMGWTSNEAAGKELEFMTVRKGHIVGVVKDFHYLSMRDAIGPLVIMNQKEGFAFVELRLSENNIRDSIEFVKQTWTKFEPGREFRYFFVDEAFNAMYLSEEKTIRLFSLFALLAVVIACLGLYGLASYTAQKRFREIGIRKILGASVPSIVKNLTAEFLKWVILANIIAVPASIIILQKYWLSRFTFNTGVSFWMIVSAVGLSVIIAFLTVYYQALKAAVANPIDSIRYE